MNSPRVNIDSAPPENTCQEHFCERCGEKLNPDTMVWLELNCSTGRYSTDGMVPESESQGCFPFGKACAAAVLKAGGRNKQIRDAAL